MWLRLLVLVLLWCPMQMVLADLQMLKNLQLLQWKSRIVIVHTDQKEQYETVLTQLQYYQAEVDDRDIIWFIDNGKGIMSNAPQPLLPRLKVQLAAYDQRHGNAQFSAVLIGKDGGIKSRQMQWGIDSIFALIDTMPMRQREMQNNDSL